MKFRLFVILLAMMPAFVKAQSWIDITTDYITNPGFDNNSRDGWEYDCSGSVDNTYDAMEFYNGTFDIYQTLTVPNGKYRVSVQGYYRTGDNNKAYAAYKDGTENITAYLYANANRVQLRSVYAEPSDYSSSGTWNLSDGSGYVPDNMYSGAQFFADGKYVNSVEVNVTDKTLRLGLTNEVHTYSCWCMFDNFKLEYYGVVKPVTGITLSSTTLNLALGETAQLTATIAPTDATYQGIAWESNNPTAIPVDQQGNITALNSGEAIITVRSTYYPEQFAACKVTATRNSAGIDKLIINEIQSCNIDMFVDPTFNYGGWIELYNPTDKAVSLYGLHLSDDIFNLTKFKFTVDNGAVPAKGFKTIWFDHDNLSPAQVTFKLDYDGGSIFLSDYDGNVLTIQDYPVGVPRTSYARTTDGGADWSTTAAPTPGRSNAGSTFATVRLEAPVVDKDAGLFESPFTVNVSIPTGATLRYTTDGSTPTLTGDNENCHTSTTGRFDVSETTTYRFRLFREGMLPSQVVTRSYIYKDRAYQFPIISVVTDPVNLYDDSLGVYVKGVNGRPGNGQSTPCNWNMDWDRPVNFEYITADGKMAVNQEVDFAMCGGWSRAWTPHSFKLKAAKIYEGKNFYDYPLFPNKQYLKHKTLQIRNGGNDTGSRIKDAALQEIVRLSGLDIDCQSVQPIHNFINGQYIGMLNMREPNNKHFAYANYGFDSDSLDQFEMSPDSGYCQMEGTKESFLRWYELSENAADNATYAEICNMVDIDEYINYMAVEFYLGGTDWPQNNVKGFRPRMEGGKFRFVLFDLDGTFATTSPFTTFENKQTYTFDVLYPSNTRITEEIEFVTIFLRMLDNATFRKKFIDTYCLVAGSVFTPERCNEIIETMAANTKDVLSWEGQNPYYTGDNMKNLLSGRQQTMINALKNYWRMQLSDISEQRVSLSANIDVAHIMVNDMRVPGNKFNGSLFAPITLKASAPAGYRFIGWRGASSNDGSTTAIFNTGSRWKYYDKGSLDGSEWQKHSYTDSNWSSGNAPLGYAKDGLNTTLDYGGNDSDKYPTYYFRKDFVLSSAPSTDEAFQLSFTVDDGFIVYVNGIEAGRYNMPAGATTFNSFATSYAVGNPDTGMLTLDASLFNKGTNYIAVEVHNNAANSSDIYFDASLSLIGPSYVSTDEEYELPATGDHTLTACYERMSDEELESTTLTPIKVNELSAANSIFINDHYKKNDWIELYNTTDEDIDIAGMYVSDNLMKPFKWQVPTSDISGVPTVIAPHSHIVIWADKLDPISQLHSSFKLASEGGEVLITAADQTWCDTLCYTVHKGEQSVGLYPDGGNTVYIMDKPTIAAANVINSYAVIYEEPFFPSGIRDIEQSGEETLTLDFDGYNALVCSANAGRAQLRVHSVAGQTWLTHSLMLSANTTESADLTALPRGIYIITATDAKGNSRTIKVVKR